MKICRKFLITLFLIASLPPALPGFFEGQEAQKPGVLDNLLIEYEAGPLYIFQNDGCYGEQGSEYNASDVGQQRNLFLSRRISAEMKFNDRHSLIFLYAPLDITTVVDLEEEINFKNKLFSSRVEHRYLFDGYRVSYLNRIMPGEKINLDLGASIQIRNAQVSFKEIDGSNFESESDIGMVFALKTRLIYTPARGGLWYMLEGDGFSTFGLLGDSVRGAIYDVKLALGVPVSTSADIIFGTRLLGGGAEVKEKYIDNWANYGAATLSLRIKK